MAKMIPDITVIMSCYNSEEYISQTIESILTQTFIDFEFIIVDDGSTDRTIDIINGYLSDQRIKFIKIAHQGSSFAKNIALESAVAKYIAITDSDDISYPERLQKQYDYLEGNPDIGLIGTSFYKINDNGEIFYKHDIQKELKHKVTSNHLLYRLNCGVNDFLHSSIMFRRELISQVKGYDESLNAALDYDFVLRLSEHTQISILSGFLVAWRRHSSQITSTNYDKQMLNSYICLLKNLYRRLEHCDETLEKRNLSSHIKVIEKKQHLLIDKIKNGFFQSERLYVEGVNALKIDHDLRKSESYFSNFLKKKRFAVLTIKALIYLIFIKIKLSASRLR